MSYNQLLDVTKQVESPDEQKSIQSLMVGTILFLLGFVPLVIRIVSIQTAPPNLGVNTALSTTTWDLFSYYKMISLFIGTILLSALFLYSFFQIKLIPVKNKIYSITAIMFLLLVISGFLAEYKTVSFLGQYNRHEGTLAFICYLILFYIAANLVYSDKHLKWMPFPLYIYSIVNACLGLIWFYNYNILDLHWVNNLLVPNSLLLSGGGFGQGSYIMNTISNPDFSSGIGAVLSCFFLTRAVLIKDLRPKFISLCFATISFSMIPVSIARSGLYTFLIMLPIISVIMFLSRERKQGFLTLIGSIGIFLCVFILLSMHNPALFERSKTLGYLGTSNFSKDIGAVIKPIVPFLPDEVYAAPSDSADEFNLPPQGWAPGTGRLYIWKETTKLISKHPFFGYGMDTLTFYFPQNDPQKNSALNNMGTIVDKPHNFFLDIAFGAGLLTFFAFLLLLLRHLYNNILLFKLGITNDKRVMIASLFSAWCAFLVQGMFNDSTVGTSPFFWILFGFAVSLLQAELTRVNQAKD